MSIFDKIIKKNISDNNSNSMRADVSALGKNDENTVDHELPSVNLRKGGNKLLDVLGVFAIVGGGLAMMYYINSDKKVEVKDPKKWAITNNLPPLEVPNVVRPSPPEPPDFIPASIPLQNARLSPTVQSPNGPPSISWSDRKMLGSMLMNVGRDSSSGASSNMANRGGVAKNEDRSIETTPLALRLHSTTSPGVSANILPDRNYLITKGTSLDCALETAIDSTLPGLATCRLTRDIYSDNGHVVLLDRGSQLVGEYQGGVTAGQARIFLLWTRAKTPNGVIVALDSPGTDALGRTGHAGWVDTHFFDRFGAAILFSLVQDGLKIAQSNNKSQVTVGGDSDKIATEILKNTVTIPPTLYVNQGDHIQIMVARDLDFSTVYDLALNE